MAILHKFEKMCKNYCVIKIFALYLHHEIKNNTFRRDIGVCARYLLAIC